MAPFHFRQPTPLIARPSLIAPSTPVQVSTLIPRRLFLQLFAGTVSIFILTVLFWKFPRFFRFLTKNKVLREGNATTTRYARTWYGWVSLQRHESNKRVFRSCMSKFNNVAPWRSSKAGFRWVWWDPGQKELCTYQERGKRWLPIWARSDGFTTADTLWNPGGSLVHDVRALRTTCSPLATGALVPPHTPRSVANSCRQPTHTSTSLQEGSGDSFSVRNTTVRRLQRFEISTEFGSNIGIHLVPYNRKRFISFRPVPLSHLSNSRLRSSLRSQLVPHSYSMPCLVQPGCFSGPQPLSSGLSYMSEMTGSADISRDGLAIFRRSRKYQVWSARMGVQTLKYIGESTHTLPKGPPGTPQSTLLGSLSLASTSNIRTHQYRRKTEQTSSSGISDMLLGSGEQHYSVGRPRVMNVGNDGPYAQKWHSVPSRNSRPIVLRPRLFPIGLPEPQTDAQPPDAGALENGKKFKRQVRNNPNSKRTAHCIVPAKDWSKWEIKLIYNLDRRLDWLATQLSPGKRPFHFALLANHWLNAETWIVYDPISRVPIEMRRRLGDPRFNVPYPAPKWTPNQKYPKTHHQPAHTPKINSWKAAMNRYRRSTGLREFIKAIEQYSSSAEDQPDGKVDPASWILRKPPQGFSLSARQKEKYYESGTGWQEKLSDWEKIRRGYRVRKVVHEGRVNRTRAKEVAQSLGRYYRQATSKLVRFNADDSQGVKGLSLD
ncbi:hypothetical protein BJX99DRAFT_266355 [Aspergillus californicus]